MADGNSFHGSDLARFERETDIVFHDKALLQRAFVHRSFLNEAGDGTDLSDNERLEYLGDAVLTFLISEHLFELFPEHQEGPLTRLRSALVRRETLARVARRLHLGELLLLGRGEEDSGGRTRPATLCAVFEAVLGAVYLDQGLEIARHFALSMLEPELDKWRKLATAKDAKSRLQELVQSMCGMTPRYKTLESTGPDHNKFFVQGVHIDKLLVGTGQGYSKQEADQEAAAMALSRLGVSAPEYRPNVDLENRFQLVDPDQLPCELGKGFPQEGEDASPDLDE